MNPVGSSIPDAGVLAATPSPERPQASASAGGFSAALTEAIQGVEKLQLDADGEARKVANGGGNLHETALALEKADVAMRLAVKVRNKIVEAYQEVMRMQI